MDVYAVVEMVEFFQDVYCNSLTGIYPQISNNKPLKIYPNPTLKEITLETNNHTIGQNYMITNIMGQLEKQGIITNNTLIIDLSDLGKGVYILTVDGNFMKIIKE